MAAKFKARLEGSDGSSATYVLVPSNVMKRFGGRIRVPVNATIEGTAWRTTICNMGAGPMIGVTAATRRAAGIERGNTVTMTLEEDTAERSVDLPPDLARSLTELQRRTYDAMSYSHRKEYVQWIEGAKRPETRSRRIASTRAKLDQRAQP